MNCAGHSDSSEQQRDEADDVKETVEIFQGFAKIAFAFLNRFKLQAQPLQLGRKRGDHSVNVAAFSKFEVGTIAGDASRPKQVQLWQIP